MWESTYVNEWDTIFVSSLDETTVDSITFQRLYKLSAGDEARIGWGNFTKGLTHVCTEHLISLVFYRFGASAAVLKCFKCTWTSWHYKNEIILLTVVVRIWLLSLNCFLFMLHFQSHNKPTAQITAHTSTSSSVICKPLVATLPLSQLTLIYNRQCTLSFPLYGLRSLSQTLHLQAISGLKKRW